VRTQKVFSSPYFFCGQYPSSIFLLYLAPFTVLRWRRCHAVTEVDGLLAFSRHSSPFTRHCFEAHVTIFNLSAVVIITTYPSLFIRHPSFTALFNQKKIFQRSWVKLRFRDPAFHVLILLIFMKIPISNLPIRDLIKMNTPFPHRDVP
jgi:hypothetical protein